MPAPEFHGRQVDFAGVDAHPRPVQVGGPPIMIGGNSAMARRRAITGARVGPPLISISTARARRARVFFADAGTLDQLRITLDDVAANARANLDELQALIAAAVDADYPFAERRHINAIAIRFQLDYNQMICDWADWATAQTDGWNDITDPDAWDWHTALT